MHLFLLTESLDINDSFILDSFCASTPAAVFYREAAFLDFFRQGKANRYHTASRPSQQQSFVFHFGGRLLHRI